MVSKNEYRDSDIYLHHSLSESPDPGNRSYETHFHDRFELYYFIAGDGHMRVEGDNIELKKGDFLIMRPGETHAMHVLTHKPYERIAVLFRREIFTGELSGLCDSFVSRPLGHVNFYKDEDGFVHSCLTNMLNADEPRKRRSVISNLAAILDHCDRLSGDSRKSFRPGHDIIRDIIRYINYHLTDDWNLDTLAAVFNHDKSYLNRIFRKSVGTGIWDYTLKKRIIAARQNMFLLDSVSEAFSSSGFKDYSNFYRRYVSMFGVSPSRDLAAYRNTAHK